MVRSNPLLETSDRALPMTLKTDRIVRALLALALATASAAQAASPRPPAPGAGRRPVATADPDGGPPFTIGIIIATLVTPNSAVISWKTTRDSNGQIEYGTTTAYGTLSPLNPNLTTSHSQALTGLAPATTYH